MASSPMDPVFKIGHREHPVDRKKYGAPYLAMYWANRKRRFAKPGLYLWAFKRQIRIFPIPRKRP